ncbi:MAG: inositol-3-phosphate synthase, partial [Burkholderiales bacterium]
MATRDADTPLVKVIDRPGSALAHAIRDFLQRSDVPFESIQVVTDEQARALAGVEHIRRGTGKPFGSITQMATIRLGKRSEKRTPLIRDFVPLASLDQLVFGSWDPIPDNAYESAV